MFKKSLKPSALGLAVLAGVGVSAAFMPQAQAASTDILVASMHCNNPCAPCAKNPCAAHNPCAANMNPCAAKKMMNPCAAHNPCAANMNPCAAKKMMNPCAAHNPCGANMNPCAAKKKM